VVFKGPEKLAFGRKQQKNALERDKRSVQNMAK
jgi:hypothetical protein